MCEETEQAVSKNKKREKVKNSTKKNSLRMSLSMILKNFLFLVEFEPGDSYKYY